MMLSGRAACYPGAQRVSTLMVDRRQEPNVSNLVAPLAQASVNSNNAKDLSVPLVHPKSGERSRERQDRE